MKVVATANCFIDKLCITDLENQPSANCRCQITSDPKARQRQCPAYCCSQSELTEVCVCDTESIAYPLQICAIDKKCKFDLNNQLNETCTCLNTSDPRARQGQCPAYCCSQSEFTEVCVCDTESIAYPLQICAIDKKCKFDLNNQLNATCTCLNTSDPRAGNGQCPVYCTGPNAPSNCVCYTNPHAYYLPQTCNSDKKFTQPSNTNVEKDSCTCSSTNYPTGCKCPSNSTELTGILQQRCECLNTGDPRAGKGECPEYCVKDSLSQQCVCDISSQSYPSATCEKNKKCKFELATQTNTTYPCLSSDDPRAGNGQCPAYCVAKYQPNVNYICDSNPSAQYPPSSCKSEKKCTAYSDQIVPTNSCTCSLSNHPTGCKCPTEIFQLIGILQSRCEFLSTGDPRAGNGQCPTYCVKGSLTSYWFCDTRLSDYPNAQCIQEQKCKFELINQNSSYCQCLSTGDPRAGKGKCPVYCTSKDQLLNQFIHKILFLQNLNYHNQQ
ncbi:MAG: hypothetical protein EZS28_034222 [Streblomastix strix]|uniref:Uncharacterized protein n=1 Tax=Streblomastix strix TaxID=222440 RepID=A0A5J4UJY4_9EUKA|nr:MAG: hypothetical protein EZS28_034222 [Streblomastix strix]